MRPRRLVAALMLFVLTVTVSGCGTLGGNKIDPTKIALAYYHQDRTYEPVKVSGVQSITLTAAPGKTVDLILTSQLQPLSIYPRDPATLSQFFDGLWKIGTVVASGYVGHEMVKGLSRGPTVVEPKVVTVPR